MEEGLPSAALLVISVVTYTCVLFTHDLIEIGSEVVSTLTLGIIHTQTQIRLNTHRQLILAQNSKEGGSDGAR